MEKKCGRNSVGKRVAYPRRVILGHDKNPQPLFSLGEFGLCVHFLGGKKYLRIDGMALWFRIMQTFLCLPPLPISHKAGRWYFFREKTYKRTRLTQSTGMTRGKKERRRGKKKRGRKNTAFPSSFFPARRVCVYSYMTCEKSLPSSSSAVCASILPFFYLPA